MAEVVKQTEKKRDTKFKRGNPGGGRPKGSKNKFTSLRDSFIEVFDRLGGVDGLYDWADKNAHNQGQFYQWITKMLPTNIDIDHKGTIDGKLTIEVVYLKGAEVPAGGNGDGNGGKVPA